ncbi:hypothetical protein [Methylorubrum aminovorans]|nr:hypothetical protein C0214_05930 [Methylobacterium sp. DM1]
MSRIVSPLTLAATTGAAAGFTALAVLTFGGAGHAETLPVAAKPLPAFAAVAHMVPVSSTEPQRDGQWAAAQERSARVARVVYPSPYASQR